jgi:hypothetical protein
MGSDLQCLSLVSIVPSRTRNLKRNTALLTSRTAKKCTVSTQHCLLQKKIFNSLEKAVCSRFWWINVYVSYYNLYIVSHPCTKLGTWPQLSRKITFFGGGGDQLAKPTYFINGAETWAYYFQIINRYDKNDWTQFGTLALVEIETCTVPA